MMKYLLMVYRDETRWETMSAREHTDFEHACRASEQDMTLSLHLIGVQQLENTGALTMTIVDRHPSLTSVPASEEQKQLMQLLFIQARDLNAAIHIASQMPHARAGAIEVRPILESKQQLIP